MAGGGFFTSTNIRNQDKVEALSHLYQKEPWHNTFWGSMMGKTRIDNNDEILSPINTNMPIEHIEGFFKNGGNDGVQLPFMKRYKSNYVYGDTTLSGTGTAPDYMFTRVFVNLERSATTQQFGTMDRLRKAGLKEFENAMLNLNNSFTIEQNVQIPISIYEGLSYNLSKGRSQNGLGLKKRLHPNWYYASGAETLLPVGGDVNKGKTKTVNQLLDAKSNTVGGLNLKMFDSIRLAAISNYISPSIKVGGKYYYGLVIDPVTHFQLLSDASYERIVNSAYSSAEFDHPIMKGAVGKFKDFIIYVDSNGIRPVINESDFMYGADEGNGYRFRDQQNINTITEENNSNLILIGRSMIATGEVPLMTDTYTLETRDHGAVNELGMKKCYGHNRIGFYEPSDEATVFTRQDTADYLGNITENNYNSMVIMVKPIQ